MPFEKGQSGNPLGRRVEQQNRSRWETLGKKSIEVIRDIIENEKLDHDLRLKAAIYACDQAFGKPAQAVNVGGQQDNPIKMIHKITISLLE